MVEAMEDIYSEGILRKAKSLAANPYAVQRDAEDESVWWVKGSTGTKYRVQLIDPADDGEETIVALGGVPFMSCTCPNGRNRGGRPSCYHTAAVLLVLEEGKDPVIMTDPNPINEDFTVGQPSGDLLGLTPEELEFLKD